MGIEGVLVTFFIIMGYKDVMGGYKSWKWVRMGGGNYWSLLCCHIYNCAFVENLRLYPTASVGSRNALHVVGAGPIATYIVKIHNIVNV